MMQFATRSSNRKRTYSFEEEEKLTGQNLGGQGKTKNYVMKGSPGKVKSPGKVISPDKLLKPPSPLKSNYPTNYPRSHMAPSKSPSKSLTVSPTKLGTGYKSPVKNTSNTITPCNNTITPCNTAYKSDQNVNGEPHEGYNTAGTTTTVGTTVTNTGTTITNTGTTITAGTYNTAGTTTTVGTTITNTGTYNTAGTTVTNTGTTITGCKVTDQEGYITDLKSGTIRSPSKEPVFQPTQEQCRAKKLTIEEDQTYKTLENKDLVNDRTLAGGVMRGVQHIAAGLNSDAPLLCATEEDEGSFLPRMIRAFARSFDKFLNKFTNLPRMTSVLHEVVFLGMMVILFVLCCMKVFYWYNGWNLGGWADYHFSDDEIRSLLYSYGYDVEKVMKIRYDNPHITLGDAIAVAEGKIHIDSLAEF